MVGRQVIGRGCVCGKGQQLGDGSMCLSLLVSHVLECIVCVSHLLLVQLLFGGCRLKTALLPLPHCIMCDSHT